MLIQESSKATQAFKELAQIPWVVVKTVNDPKAIVEEMLTALQARDKAAEQAVAQAKAQVKGWSGKGNGKGWPNNFRTFSGASSSSNNDRFPQRGEKRPRDGDDDADDIF